MLSEFRAFLFRGNLLDLAVAIVIGTAFVALVKALVDDLITPIIAAIVGEPDFGALHFTIDGSVFLCGDFLNALLSFVLIAAAVFFVIMKPVNVVIARRAAQEAPETPTRACPSA